MMDPQRRDQLGVDAAEGARLQAGLRKRDGVAVHGIALPDDRVAALAHRVDVRPQLVRHMLLPVPRDQRHLPDLLAWVDDVQQRHQVGRRCRRPDLDPDGVFESPEILDVCALGLTRSIADPEEVRGCVVPSFRRRSSK